MNIFTFSGNCGSDAEQRFTPGGDSVVSFNVAVKSGFGEKAKTSWIKCTMFGKRGESVFPMIKKGMLLTVSGEFTLDEWTGKEGDKRVTASVRVNELDLPPKGQSQGSSSAPSSQPSQSYVPQQKSSQGAQGGAFDDMSNDIPFNKLGAGRAWRVI